MFVYTERERKVVLRMALPLEPERPYGGRGRGQGSVRVRVRVQIHTPDFRPSLRFLSAAYTPASLIVFTPAARSSLSNAILALISRSPSVSSMSSSILMPALLAVWSKTRQGPERFGSSLRRLEVLVICFLISASLLHARRDAIQI